MAGQRMARHWSVWVVGCHPWFCSQLASVCASGVVVVVVVVVLCLLYAEVTQEPLMKAMSVLWPASSRDRARSAEGGVPKAWYASTLKFLQAFWDGRWCIHP